MSAVNKKEGSMAEAGEPSRPYGFLETFVYGVRRNRISQCLQGAKNLQCRDCVIKLVFPGKRTVERNIVFIKKSLSFIVFFQDIGKTFIRRMKGASAVFGRIGKDFHNLWKLRGGNDNTAGFHDACLVFCDLFQCVSDKRPSDRS